MFRSLIHFIQTHKKVTYPVGILYLLASLYFSFKSPVIYPDSEGYLKMAVIRGPGYPLFLAFFRIFGKIISIKVAVFFQVTLNFLVGYLFGLFLKQSYKLSDISYLIIAVFLIYPLHLYSYTILSEALAFPLFLSFIALYLKYLETKQQNFWYISLLVLLVLILTRTQFLFLLPLMIILEFVIEKTFNNIFFKHTLLVIFIFIASLFLDKTYHYFKHGVWASTPFTGIQIATTALYTAQTDDFKLFDHPEDQHFVKEVLDSAYQKQILFQNLTATQKNDLLNISAHSQNTYNALCHETMRAIWFKKYNTKNSEMNSWQKFDKKTLFYALKLISKNKKDFFSVYINKIMTKTGGKIYFMVYLLVLGLLFFKCWFTKNRYGMLLLLAFTASLFNMMLIALVEPLLPRYTLYTDTLLGVAILMIFLETFILRSNSQK